MLFNIIVFFLFLTGVGFIVYSSIKFKPAEKPQTEEQVKEMLKRIEATVSDADNAINEFNAISQNIFEVMEAKYKEILFLYELLDQKKNIDINNTNNTMPSAPTNVFPNKVAGGFSHVKNKENLFHQPIRNESDDTNFMSVFKSANPKHKEINNLAQRGMSIAEIARSLNIGQGEVSLVLGMRRE